MKLNLNLQVKQGANIIQNGGIVAFPTETVYGLAANAFDEQAIAKIFKLKNRPADNPLIVHISSLDMLSQLVNGVSKENQKLIDAFWPGPLSLVFPKSKLIPNIVTAGLDTVVIRFPSNHIARQFISECGVPLAAPSVNPSGKPSSTQPQQIRDYFDNKVFIVEGRPSEIGIESTVINTLVTPPMILRQGYITKEQIQEILNTEVHLSHKTTKIQAPGMKYRHYAPEARLELVPLDQNIISRIEFYLAQNYKVGALVSTQVYNLLPNPVIGFDLGEKYSLETISANLYAGLHYFDSQEVDIIIAESFPNKGLGLAIMDRLKRAAETLH
jgi:L-threonylcarbamoyladenylate synthase